jgi:DinB superfamily
MGVTYAERSDVGELDPVTLRDRLMQVVTEAKAWLVLLTDAEASVPEREGKWSVKQVVGHLTDSAVNNLGRIVNMQISAGQRMPGYEQEEWVALQHYQEREWKRVVQLWVVLNWHLAWTIENVAPAKLGQKGFVGETEWTLGYLIEDYIAHMEHHLRLMKGWLG